MLLSADLEGEKSVVCYELFLKYERPKLYKYQCGARKNFTNYEAKRCLDLPMLQLDLSCQKLIAVLLQ